MFWIVWLPLIVLFLVALISILYDISSGVDLDSILEALWRGIKVGFWVFVVGIVINIVGAATITANLVYADIEHPIYLARVPDQNTPKYIVSTEALNSGGVYTYYFINNHGVPDSANSNPSYIRLVEDNPAKPFYAPVKHTCPFNRFWFLWCSSNSPYTMEFHVPPDSILKTTP